MKMRKGAIKASDIPNEVLNALNNGSIESANLTEWLAVDHKMLMESVLSAYPSYLKSCKGRIATLKGSAVRPFIVEIGRTLCSLIKENKDVKLFEYLSTHQSDSVRCWAVYIVGLNEELNLASKFDAILQFAEDSHFGVRELAWMAMREDIDAQLEESIEILSGWINIPNENVRRFVTESTRPRGVWCKHISALKDNPEIALRLLEPLKADPSEYVQLSLGNWLNDAAKTSPDWVLALCERWGAESPSAATLKIIKRAKRSLIS